MKRELITREDALMALTGNFDLGVTMNQYTLNCQKHIKAINAIPEKEIVKPYFEELKRLMKKRDNYISGGEPLNAVDRGYHLACEHLYNDIDKLLS